MKTHTEIEAFRKKAIRYAGRKGLSVERQLDFGSFCVVQILEGRSLKTKMRYFYADFTVSEHGDARKTEKGKAKKDAIHIPSHRTGTTDEWGFYEPPAPIAGESHRMEYRAARMVRKVSSNTGVTVIFSLFYDIGLTEYEIAQVFGWSVLTVKKVIRNLTDEIRENIRGQK